MAASSDKRLFVVLGNQLFPLQHLEEHRDALIFMREDRGLCTYERHHQQKIVLFLAAMRAYRDELEAAGFDVHYECLGDDTLSYEESLAQTILDFGAKELLHFEIEDKPVESRMAALAKRQELKHTILRSPGFLCDRAAFASFINSAKRPFMADFYKAERRRLDILVDADGNPDGERWSFDADNRKKLPRNLEPPELGTVARNKHVSQVIRRVEDEFPDHPGRAADFWWPTRREEALAWFEQFLAERLANFGPYEDAMSQRSDTLFHSLLSPLLNLGLLTPDEVIERALEYTRRNDVPMQSIEGLVRQIIGWREFIRGIYRHFSEEQEEKNHWSHQRELTDDWYAASTGIPPLDDAIDTATRLGWTHHIPRLMVVANLMTLCEIRPASAHRWFMEMFVDSSEWVMGPNVYGMGLFSDGGIFATKPYICGSNYLLKMSDYKKGDWCDVVDGLYWRFIDKHRKFFAEQPRLALMPRALDKLAPDRVERIFAAAEGFLETYTQAHRG